MGMLAGLAERPAERVRGSISEDAMKHTGISGSLNLGLIYPYTCYIAQRSTLGASMTTPPSATCPPRVVEEDIYLDSSANVGLLD